MVIHDTHFFSNRFGVQDYSGNANINAPEVHMIIYLQVAIISQALIFVTRSHSFSFLERPSVALMGAFCLAQLVSSIIAAFGDWGFTDVRGISGGWIGIVWVWNIIWYFPLDLVKFAMKYSLIAWLQKRKAAKVAAALPEHEGGAPMRRTQSRHESLYVSGTAFVSQEVRQLTRCASHSRTAPTSCRAPWAASVSATAPRSRCPRRSSPASPRSRPSSLVLPFRGPPRGPHRRLASVQETRLGSRRTEWSEPCTVDRMGSAGALALEWHDHPAL